MKKKIKKIFLEYEVDALSIDGYSLTVITKDRFDEIIQDIDVLFQQIKKPLLKALKEIAKGEGPYDMDHLKHASNTIDNMKEIANKAIKEEA